VKEIKDDEMHSIDTMESERDKECASSSSSSSLFLKVPRLNLELIKNQNYDSEKEYYENMEDKLKKIKKRFAMLKKELK
jgi:hypothetical protein